MTTPHKKKILVVDDNEVFLNALKSTIEAEGYAVTPSSEAQGALHLIGLENFDLILSDMQMPGMSGINFLKKVREQSQIPFILMTGFSEIQETTDAHSIGASGFLAKPFKREELLSLVVSLIPAKKETVPEPAPEPTENDYVALPIENFISGSNIRFSIHIRLSNRHFVKIAHQGEDVDPNKINQFKTKGIKFLYLSKPDYRDYVGFMTHLNKVASKSSTLDREKKNKIMRSAGEVLVSSLFKSEMNRESVEVSQAFVQSTLDMISDEPQALSLLASMNEHGDHLFAHCIGVSTVAVAIAHALGWTAGSTLMKVSLSGLYHDVGKKEIPAEILAKGRMQMSPEEVAIYQTHPQRGSDLLSQVPGITDEITLVAGQHHENCVGTGYPRKLTLNKITPLARLIAVADAFVKLVIKNPDYPVPIDPQQAFNKMVSLKANELDPQYVKALEACLKKEDKKAG